MSPVSTIRIACLHGFRLARSRKIWYKSKPVSEQIHFTKGMVSGMKDTNQAESSSKVLSCSGCQVDVLMEVMRAPHWTTKSLWDVNPNTDNEALLQCIISFAELGPESGPEEDHVWRTLSRGRLLSHNHLELASEDIRQLIRKTLRQEHVDARDLSPEQKSLIVPWDDEDPDSHSRLPTLLADWQDWTLDSIVRGFFGRTLFKTKTGVLGLGHAAVHPRDFLTLLKNQKGPIVLRPRCADAGSEGFEFVGDAYVDGIMHKKVLDGDQDLEMFDVY